MSSSSVKLCSVLFYRLLTMLIYKQHHSYYFILFNYIKLENLVKCEYFPHQRPAGCRGQVIQVAAVQCKTLTVLLLQSLLPFFQSLSGEKLVHLERMNTNFLLLKKRKRKRKVYTLCRHHTIATHCMNCCSLFWACEIPALYHRASFV